jgi:hypothetical protein
MTELNTDIIVALIGVSGAVTMIVAMIVLRLTLTRRLKKDLESSGQYWKSGTLDFGFFNTIIFALACTLSYVPRSKNYRLIYNDLDVKSKTNPFERMVAYSMLVGLALLLLSSLLVFVTQQAGWIKWPN